MLAIISLTPNLVLSKSNSSNRLFKAKQKRKKVKKDGFDTCLMYRASKKINKALPM
jgi:hypothetical protein